MNNLFDASNVSKRRLLLLLSRDTKWDVIKSKQLLLDADGDMIKKFGMSGNSNTNKEMLEISLKDEIGSLNVHLELWDDLKSDHFLIAFDLLVKWQHESNDIDSQPYILRFHTHSKNQLLHFRS